MYSSYYITIGHTSYSVTGVEAAYSAYRDACNMATLLDFHPMVCLCDGETGEVIADNMEA